MNIDISVRLLIFNTIGKYLLSTTSTLHFLTDQSIYLYPYETNKKLLKIYENLLIQCKEERYQLNDDQLDIYQYILHHLQLIYMMLNIVINGEQYN